MRLLSFVIPILAVIAVATAVFQASYNYFQAQELIKAEGRLSLYRGSVAAELNRFSHLTYILARDPYVIAATKGDDTGSLNLRLEGFAAQAGLEAIYLMERNGQTIDASNHRLANSFIGQNYAFRPYFQDALKGQQGRFYAIGSTTGLPGYFVADAVPVQPGGKSAGVIAIKIDFSALEQSWQNSGEQVLLANRDGVVLLASNPHWRYRTLAPLSDDQKQRIETARQFPSQTLAALDWAPMAAPWARIGADNRLHLSSQDLPNGWQLHYFTGDDRVAAQSWLVTALVVFVAGLALISIQFQRARRVARALARAEKEEAQLRLANDRLAREIEDRRRAERRLKRTQGELEQVSRLAALGRIAASVTHELGQPIAAMRNHLAAAEMTHPQHSPLVGKISGLVDRMEGITRQLKFFARSQPEEFASVDLNDALHAALALVEPNLQQTGAQVHLALDPQTITLRGNRLRIEQVMTNLLRNALDAMEDCAAPRLEILSGCTTEGAWFEIRDTGHGLGKTTLAELQEPFVTTRESGRGMGLGLAISAGIVKDHGGEMSARPNHPAGTCFKVFFPLPPQDEGPSE